MTIQTQCTDRRELVRRLSSHLQTPAVYMRVPTCAYRIGEITVERDGSITGDEEMLTRIKPFLLKCGYVEADQAHMAFSASLSDWTVPQMIRCAVFLPQILEILHDVNSSYVFQPFASQLRQGDAHHKTIRRNSGGTRTASNNLQRHPDLFCKVSEGFFFWDVLHRPKRFTRRRKGRGVFALSLGFSLDGLFPPVCFRLCHFAGFDITQSLWRFPCRCAEVLFTLFVPTNTAMKLE